MFGDGVADFGLFAIVREAQLVRCQEPGFGPGEIPGVKTCARKTLPVVDSFVAQSDADLQGPMGSFVVFDRLEDDAA